MWPVASRSLFAVITVAFLLGQEKPDSKPDSKPGGLPIKPERKIVFTTNEGTWMSLDVSPDGKSVHFELLGDFYSLPMESCEAMPVINRLQFDMQTMQFSVVRHMS